MSRPLLELRKVTRVHGQGPATNPSFRRPSVQTGIQKVTHAIPANYHLPDEGSVCRAHRPALTPLCSFKTRRGSVRAFCIFGVPTWSRFNCPMVRSVTFPAR